MLTKTVAREREKDKRSGGEQEGMQNMRRLSHTHTVFKTTTIAIATINTTNEFDQQICATLFLRQNEIFDVKSAETEITICSGEKCAQSNVAT